MEGSQRDQISAQSPPYLVINVLEWQPEVPAEENMSSPVRVAVHYDGKKLKEEIVIG